MKANLAPFLWRYSLLKRYLHLFLLLKNWKARILAERDKKTGTNQLFLRNGLTFQTEGSIKITNDVFLEIFQSKSYLKFISTSPEILVDVVGILVFSPAKLPKSIQRVKSLRLNPLQKHLMF